MADKYIDIANGPLAGIVKKLGLPSPVKLRRFDSGAAYLKEPILLVGTGSSADTLGQLLEDNGFRVHRIFDPAYRYGGIVADYTQIETPADLAEITLGIGSALKRMTACTRIITIAHAPDNSASAELNSARQAVEGITRSLAHEMLRGSTTNGIQLDGVGLDAPSVRGALWFLLSSKSAYVSGQFLRVNSTAGTSIDAEQFAATGKTGPLAGKTAVVTGAARGIGAAIAKTLARDGADVVGVDVPPAGDALAKTMNSIGGRACALDVTAEDAGVRLAEAVGVPVDILVHNAGITRDKLLANMNQQQWDSVIAVNLESQLRINSQLDDAWGSEPHVVSLASTSGIAGNRGQTNYSASKAGVIGMAAACAEDFAARGGSINAVAPGFIETDMTAAMPFLTRQVARRLSSLQQGGLPVDVAEAIAFLSSPAAGGINGQTLRVCGQNMVGA